MMNTTGEKFKRFLAMTDRPEDFSEEELMELVRDPEMAAWYKTLADVEEAAKSTVPTTRARGSRYQTMVISLLASAAILTLAFLLWPEQHEGLRALPEHQPTIAAVQPQATDSATEPSSSSVPESPSAPESIEKKPQPVIVQQTKQEHLLAVNKREKSVSQKSETESLEQKIASLTIVPTSADLGPGVTMRLGGSADTIAHKGVDEPLEQMIAGVTIVPTSADLGPGVKMRFGGSADTLAHKGVDEPLEQKIVSLTIVPTSADLGPGVTMRLGKPCPITAGVEPLQEEEVSPIPADKQALADLYLAEEALQVAYERRAQVEAIRAYAASIKGEKLPKPVIAF